MKLERSSVACWAGIAGSACCVTAAILAGCISIFAIVVAMTGIVVGNILQSDPHSDFAGLFQRIIEGSILSWIVLFCVYLKKTGRSQNGRRAVETARWFTMVVVARTSA
jgi:hypothetical protein